jgi:thymidylate kinase
MTFKRPVIIVFIGSVGAGKTTHILAAFNSLRKRYKVHKTYIKTTFFTTMLLSRLRLSRGTVWRFAVALDLLLNSVLLPAMMWLRTVLLPLLARKQIVLVEEHLPGSLVDYAHAAITLSLVPIARSAMKILTRSSQKSMWSGLVFVSCDKGFLPGRWAKRKTPSEYKTYLLVQDLVFKILSKKCKNSILHIDTSKEFNYNRRMVEEFILHNLRQV